MRSRNLLLAAALLAPFAASAQRFTEAAPITAVKPPVILPSTDLFQAVFAQVGDDIFIGGQPTERALREMKEKGVTTVVNLRTPEEMKSSVSFDEAALIEKLGMKYVHLPVRGNADMPYSPAVLDKFTQALRDAKGGKVLLHCTIAWRASHLWAAYLIRERNIPVEDALAHTRLINLMDDHRMGNGRQPVEDFLDRTLPTIGRGKGF